MSSSRSIALLKNLAVITFVVGLPAFGVRSVATQDSRFGWGMFHQHTEFLIHYEWAYPDGSHQGVANTAADLPARQSIISGDRTHTTRYGVGALRRWIGSHPEHLYKQRKPEGAEAVRARLVYVINQERVELQVLHYPPINQG